MYYSLNFDLECYRLPHVHILKQFLLFLRSQHNFYLVSVIISAKIYIYSPLLALAGCYVQICLSSPIEILNYPCITTICRQHFALSMFYLCFTVVRIPCASKCFYTTIWDFLVCPDFSSCIRPDLPRLFVMISTQFSKKSLTR